MEKHLTRIASSVYKYISRMEIIQRTAKELREKEREEKKNLNLFLNKLNVLRRPLSAYQNAVSPILDEVGISIRVETWQHDSHIARNMERPQSLILLAIAPNRATQRLRWQRCNFLAFYGDIEKKEIHIYQYTQEPHDGNEESKSLIWDELKKYSVHLKTYSVDHFNFDTAIPLITTFLSRELHYLLARFNPDQIMQSINSKPWKTY
ncbi:hypothetical protein [Sphingobacterium tabacisoli]|uniref:Uncharacterized protein n=1 Tax=Sphingobacterium tabacisoli TaxID=2044855 RepID=A0ABW5L500_9SPHI|nr:hypothetical protein [Sphingobacterium tabacisoli]